MTRNVASMRSRESIVTELAVPSMIKVVPLSGAAMFG
jgi:hypothetical protein